MSNTPSTFRAILFQLREYSGDRIVNSGVSLDRFSATYPTSRIRGRRITRLEEQSLGWSKLDARTAEELGREQIG